MKTHTIITDEDRLDFLADSEQMICNLVLPRQVVERNVESLRGAIDYCMEHREFLNGSPTMDEIDTYVIQNP